ncbi:MAG TPA: TetR family transcriptional regulator [Mycobacterium sp.]|nr:TetR family transcriptional regulator [Mycobacterium sp.]
MVAAPADRAPADRAPADRKRPGRPPGNTGNRDRILRSARELFSRNGFSNTSVRAVAASSGVDSALVHHYFGTKRQLFAAAMHIPIDPMTIIGPLRATPVSELGHTLPSLLLPLWDSALGEVLVGALRSILGGTDVSLARNFFHDIVVAELAVKADDPPGTGTVRAEFVASQMLGVAMTRYILRLEPLATLPAEQIADTIAPTLQRYLTGELPDLSRR